MLEKVRDQAIEKLRQEVAQALRILVTGGNGSSFAIRIVAMRLLHLGCQVYVVGENITPSIIRTGDLLIACCESGGSGSVCVTAQKARGVGARIVSVTTQAESLLGQMSDVVIKIAVGAKPDRSCEQLPDVSLFEQSTLLLFDALFYVMTRSLNESADLLWALHTGLE